MRRTTPVTDTENPQEPAGDSADSDIQPVADGELPAEDWENSEELAWAESSAQEMAGYGATLHRIEWMIFAAGLVCAAAVAWLVGWAAAVGMLIGILLGWINFRWLASSVNAIGERIVDPKGRTKRVGAKRERGAKVVARGVGRIFLMALFAYVIFTCSLRGLVGFLAGLAMPVIAIMCEAAYEFVAVNRRPS
jgi:hypothetical protein